MSGRVGQKSCLTDGASCAKRSAGCSVPHDFLNCDSLEFLPLFSLYSRRFGVSLSDLLGVTLCLSRSRFQFTLTTANRFRTDVFERVRSEWKTSIAHLIPNLDPRVDQGRTVSIAPHKVAPSDNKVDGGPAVRVNRGRSPGSITVSRTRTRSFSRSNRWCFGAATRASSSGGQLGSDITTIPALSRGRVQVTPNG